MTALILSYIPSAGVIFLKRIVVREDCWVRLVKMEVIWEGEQDSLWLDALTG